MPLAALSEVDTGRLLDESLGRLSLSPEMRSAVVDRSGGNPLYAEEYVRMLADLERQVILTKLESRTGTMTCRCRRRLRASSPPASTPWIRPTRRCCRMPQCWAKSVGPVLSPLSPGLLRHGAKPASGSGSAGVLAFGSQSTLAGEQQYAFRHVLVRDVAYQHLPRRARAERHQRAATWLQSLPADRSDDRAELLAHHWQAAYQYARASRQPTSGSALSARLALRAAGDRALSLIDFEGADRWYSAALELWPQDNADRPLLLLRLGEAQVQSAGKGSPILAEAADRLLADGDVERAAEATSCRPRCSTGKGSRPPPANVPAGAHPPVRPGPLQD